MRLASISLGAMALTGCGAAVSSGEAKLMDAIESQIVLPPPARPIDAYARYYARGPDGSVIATYVLPDVYKEELGACRGTDCQQAPLIGAGERRWLADRYILPVVAARSCALIVMVYNPAKHRIEELRCTEGLS